MERWKEKGSHTFFIIRKTDSHVKLHTSIVCEMLC
jgi:hypothetical protein